jgi:hypothetical protein
LPNKIPTPLESLVPQLKKLLPPPPPSFSIQMNANRTNRSKVINRAIHILFHGRVNKLPTYYCLNDLVPSYNKC